MSRTNCDYCWRPAVASLLLPRTLLRVLLRMPRRRVAVCVDHILTVTRHHG